MKPDLERKINADGLIVLGHNPLTKKELLELISNNTVTGDYEYNGHRIYKTFMNKNGTMIGKNDWDSLVEGS